jgi:hypothetical protein
MKWRKIPESLQALGIVQPEEESRPITGVECLAQKCSINEVWFSSGQPIDISGVKGFA